LIAFSSRREIQRKLIGVIQSLLIKAIHYALGEWKGGKYTADRKKFYFSGSDASAQNGAFAYSLTQSYTLCNINPYVLLNAIEQTSKSMLICRIFVINNIKNNRNR